jgi:hypothetical protein
LFRITVFYSLPLFNLPERNHNYTPLFRLASSLAMYVGGWSAEAERTASTIAILDVRFWYMAARASTLVYQNLAIFALFAWLYEM